MGISNSRKAVALREDIFAHEFVIHFNGTQSAIKAGFSEKTAAAIASEFLNKPSVQKKIGKLIADRADRLKISADQVLDEIRRFAFIDMADAFNEDGSLKKIHAIPEEIRRCIAGFEVKELWEGSGKYKKQVGILTKVKFIDKSKGLELFGKNMAMWVERMEHSAPGGQPLQINTTVNFVKAKGQNNG